MMRLQIELECESSEDFERCLGALGWGPGDSGEECKGVQVMGFVRGEDAAADEGEDEN